MWKIYETSNMLHYILAVIKNRLIIFTVMKNSFNEFSRKHGTLYLKMQLRA